MLVLVFVFAFVLNAAPKAHRVDAPVLRVDAATSRARWIEFSVASDACPADDECGDVRDFRVPKTRFLSLKPQPCIRE